MNRLILLVLACVSVVFARGPGPLDGKNVTVSAKGRALCAGRPIPGTVKLVLFDTQCDPCNPYWPRETPFAEAKLDKSGNYRIEASIKVPTHGATGGHSRIYVELTYPAAHRRASCELDPGSPLNEWDDEADIPAEYWNVEGDRKKVFEHDFQEK